MCAQVRKLNHFSGTCGPSHCLDIATGPVL